MAKQWVNLRVEQSVMNRLIAVRQRMERHVERGGVYPLREHGRDDGAISLNTVLSVLLVWDERHAAASRKPRSRQRKQSDRQQNLLRRKDSHSEEHVYMQSQGG